MGDDAGKQTIVGASAGRLFKLHEDRRVEFLSGTSDQDIVAILAMGDELVIVRADGLIERRAAHDLAVKSQQHYRGEIASAAGLPWLGGMRLLLAGGTGPICCIGLDDELVTHYRSPYPHARMVCAARDAVAAVTPDRQRLVIWPIWDGREPATENHIAALARHRIADIAAG